MNCRFVRTRIVWPRIVTRFFASALSGGRRKRTVPRRAETISISRAFGSASSGNAFPCPSRSPCFAPRGAKPSVSKWDVK
ncbi:MAG: hypothetical protein O7J95_16595 [Planctomycetota bacterium]|nr:hypothetical protein [Planctomycetota bacterium]